MDYKELTAQQEFSAQLHEKYENFRPNNVVVHFNVLDEMHANENAHTRILKRLLQQPTICKSFVEYVAKKRKDLACNLLPFTEDNFSVNCLSDYVDARIEYGGKVIIIENKVKDAIDQGKQIDRYVYSALKNHRAADIFVIYLTRDGQKKVQDYSFNDTKKVLEYESEALPGRFISLNYKDDIVGWLEKDVVLSVDDLQHQPYLRSGIEQYLHYIQGPELLGLRVENDPYKDLSLAFERNVDEYGLNLAVNALAELYKDAILSSSSADWHLVELFRTVVRRKCEEMENSDIEFWNQLDCPGWGVVDYRYWWRQPSGFALQLCENFTIEHAVRALEFFPRRGVEIASDLQNAMADLLPRHPYFTYQWNGRIVYKFPVSEKKEAQSLADELWRVIEASGAETILPTGTR